MSGGEWVPVDTELRTELFDAALGGEGKKFSSLWLLQHIDFPPLQNECRLQLKQYYDGPCGALASIQVIKWTTSLIPNQHSTADYFSKEAPTKCIF